MNNVTRLNNRKLKALRRDPIYEAVMTDLCLIGAIDKAVVERLIGRKMSDKLVDPIPDLRVEEGEEETTEEGGGDES